MTSNESRGRRVGGKARTHRIALKFMLLASASAAMTLGLPVAGHAQTQATDSSQSGGVAEVVVTARKRNESLLTVPVTVTAFTAEDMAVKGIVSLTDVANFTPGLKLDATAQSRNDRSNQTLIIRGMTPTFNGNVSVFIDGAPVVGNGYVEGVDTVDRVEVLKGPQSATFGRATFAGAINLVTSDPTAAPHANVDVSVETYNGYDVKGMVEGTIIPDKLTAMVQGKFFSTDGTYKNSANPSETIGAQKTDAINVTLKFTPIENLSLKVFGDYWIDHDGPGATGILPDTTYNCAAGAAGATKNYVCGPLPQINLNTIAVNDTLDTAVQNVLFKNVTGKIAYMPGMSGSFSDHAGIERRAYHTHGILNYDIPAIDATLTAVTSYDEDKYEYVGDLDNQNTINIPNPNYTAANASVTQPYVNWPALVQFVQYGYSEEARLQGGSKGPFHWSLGGSYVFQSSGFSTGALLQTGPINFQLPTTVQTQTTGGFFSLGYDVTSQISLTFDGRVENEKQTLYSLYPTAVQQAQESFTNFMPRALIQYKPTKDIMVYFSYSEGVNPGGFNDNLASGFTAADVASIEKQYGVGLSVAPEKIDNYELGIKGKFFDNRLEMTADVYHAIWNNQVTENNVRAFNSSINTTEQLQLYENAGQTLLTGFELEGTFKPVTGLTFNGSLGYTPSDIRKFICTACAQLITGSTNVTGNQLPNVPALTANLGAEYRRPLIGEFDGYARVDWLYTGRIYEDYTNLAWVKDNSKVNVHVGVTRGRATLEGYVNNVFDDLTYVNAQNNTDLIHGGNAVILGLPLRRVFGLRYRQSF
jgi:iron complex outermembrane receptor protein